MNNSPSKCFVYLFLQFLVFPGISNAQPYRFFYSDNLKFLKANNDTLLTPFTGGMNAPQFSNIDFNGDHVPDLFIFDRSSNKITALVNKNGKYFHAPEFEGRFPYVTDWCLLRDYDADGKPDLFSEVSADRKQMVDTAVRVFKGGARLFKNISSPDAGLRFKQLTNQLMDTGGIFKDLGLFKDRERIDVNATDMPAIDDIDGDGDADILAFQYLGLSPHYYENYMLNKYQLGYDPDSTRYIYRDDCWGYCEYDRTFSRNIFELNLNPADMAGGCFFSMYEKKQHAANTMFMIDYNGDGVKDVVYGDGSGGTYQNLILLINGRKLNAFGRDSIIAQDTAFPSNTKPAQFITFPAGYYVDIDGDGTNELLVTTNEPISAKSVNNVWVYENKGTTDKPDLEYLGNNFFLYDETIDLGTRSVPSPVDIDGDGDLDLVVATNGDFSYTHNANDRLVLFRNRGNVNGRAVFELADTNFLMLSGDTPLFSIYPAFADLNGDLKPDMLVGNDKGNLLYYTNQGTGTSYKFHLESRMFFNIDAGSSAAPSIADMDGDGKQDLIIGNRDGILKYFRNSGNLTSPQFPSTSTIDSFGFVTVNDSYIDFNGNQVVSQYGYASPFVYDLDEDGKNELLVGSDGGKVFLYTDVSVVPGARFTKHEQVFTDYSDELNGRSIRFGKRSAPCIASLDEDDKPDVLIGNLSGGLFFYSSKNTYTPMPNGLGETIELTRIFSVFPNPANGLLHIRYSDLSEDAGYKLSDQSGQCLDAGPISRYHAEETIDTGKLAPGIYYLSILSTGFPEIHKVVVLR